MTTTAVRPARYRLFAAVAAAALAAAIIPAHTAAPAVADTGLSIASVSAPDNKSIEITFDRALSEGLQQFVAANVNAIRTYIRVSGGTAGQSDAALNGASLQTVNANVFPVDTPEANKLRIVLPAATTLSATASYELWFDGIGRNLGDLQIRGADGTAMEGETTPPVAFDGTATAASLAQIASVEALTSRLVRLTFAQSILSGMPAHTYSTNPSRITVQNAPTGVRPVYVQKMAGVDSRVFDVYLNGDLEAGEAYTLQVLGNPTGTQAASAIRTTAGTAPASTPLGGDGSFLGVDEVQVPRIDHVEVNDARTQLTIRFNHKLRELSALPSWVPGDTGNRTVLETAVTATTGDSLTAAELTQVLRINGRLSDGPLNPPAPPGRPDTPGQPAQPGQQLEDLTEALRYTAAYFADRQTLVVSLAEGKRFQVGSAGEVTLLADSVIDVSGAGNGGSEQSVGFTAPTGPSPQRSVDYSPNGPDYLSVDRDSSTVFTRYDYTYAAGTNPPNYRVNAADVTDRVIDEEINAIVVENKYIKATFTPEYGARLLSLIYKPTGNDLLYANPVGTPYGHGNNSPFYANWLMVWGGIAPTFSEAEHGKFWFLPWDYEIEETDDQVTIRMSQVDNINHRLDGRFRYGATGLEIEVAYTIYKNLPIVDYDVTIHNPGTQTREYEYWTLTTLGPGRPLHEGSATMEHLVPVDRIRRDSAYTWMANVEERINPEAPANSVAGRELYLRNMRYFSRWLTGTQTGGIAYALGLADSPQADWWGVVNHENEEGILRIAPNDVTRGMKFWTWGFDRSFDTNPYSKGNSARPYVEPWGGVSDAFFQPDTLGPGQTKSWTETYLPIQDLHDVTNANANGAAHIEFNDDGTVTGYLFPTDLGKQVLKATLADADTGAVIATRTFKADEYASLKLAGHAGDAASVSLTLQEVTGSILLTAERTR